MKTMAGQIALFIALVAILPLSLPAKHIIGGELTYQYISAGRYHFNLKMFRDCNTSTPFDSSITFYVFNTKCILIDSFRTKLAGTKRDTPVLNNPCTVLPSGICVEECTYNVTANLPLNISGLYVVYQRCCRNNVIVNIIDPGLTGSTYFVFIPPPTTVAVNSSPRFKKDPPLVVCDKLSVNFDMSAVDPDGDSLVYCMITPNNGATATVPSPHPASAPPYDTVEWVSGFSANNEIGGTPRLSINSKTGTLTGVPCCIGIYVVGVAVREYRHGVFLGETRRDFEFIIIDCKPPVVAAFNTPTPFDTVTLCDTKTLDVVNNSYGKMFTYSWNFGDRAHSGSDTDTAANPVYHYADTGYYRAFLYINKGTTCFDTTWRIISVRHKPVAKFTAPTVCFSMATPINDLSYSNNNTTLKNRFWHFGDGDSSYGYITRHVYKDSGVFTITVMVSDQYKCTAADTVVVAVKSGPVSYRLLDTLLCDKDTVRLSAHPASGDNFVWLTHYNINDTLAFSTLAWPKHDTVYVARITSPDGCAVNDTAKLTVIDSVNLSIFRDTGLCYIAPVQLIASGAQAYQWVPAKTLSNAFVANPVANVTGNTTYLCYGKVGQCSGSKKVVISVLKVPYIKMNVSDTVNEGNSLTLNASTNGVKYKWEPATTLNSIETLHPKARPLTTTTYYLAVVGADGCTNADSLIVVVTHLHKFYVPTAFTPNGDGLNDVLQYNYTGIKNLNYFRVFNRWGQCIFSTSDLNTYWDGTFNSLPEETGVYVYYFEAVTFEGKIVVEKGNVTLLR